MIQQRPKFLSFIGYFYCFGALILLFSLGTDQEVGMAVRFGIPNVPETIVRVSIAVIALVMAYGYLKLTRWGFWLTILYTILFSLISINLVSSYNSQPFIGNAIWSVIVLVYTIVKRKYFTA